MDNDHQYMLIAEVAQIARTSPDTVRAWLRSGRLPSVRPGRRRLIRRADFEQFMAPDVLVERRRRNQDNGSE